MSLLNHTLTKELGFRIIGFVTWLVVTLLFQTYRVSMFGREVEKEFIDTHKRGVLLASWHRGLFYFCYFYRYLKYVVMLSASNDADLFEAAIKRFGWIPVRGSSSLQGSEALREMQAFFEQGHGGGIVIDAPKGPPHVSKIGIIILAKRTGVPIFPVMWSADRYWRLNTWDGSIIPKPFARIVFLYSPELIYVPEDATREECEEKRKQLDEILNTMMYQTDNFFDKPEISDPRHIEIPQNLDSWVEHNWTRRS